MNSVFQLQAMNEMMKEQFYAYPVNSVMILGIAGGNGLEHIDKQVFSRVYGVDINKKYLNACKDRYPGLQGILETIHADLTCKASSLPEAELVVANLFIEYIGYECFQKVVSQVKPKHVSCIIQINTDISFVSDSPYLPVFDRLDEVHHQMREEELADAMSQIGYRKEAQTERALPNGKKLVRMDFEQYPVIRKMTIGDYDQVFDLWKETEGMGLRSLDDSKEGIALFLNRNPDTCFVALDGDAVTGVILCGQDGRRGYIYHTVVRKDCRNRGIATQLVAAATAALQKQNITRVCLNVLETNESGKRFWQERGWEKKDFLGFYSKSITDRENLPLFGEKQTGK